MFFRHHENLMVLFNCDLSDIKEIYINWNRISDASWFIQY